ncbi:MAG TPA: hypothetical protein VMD92_02680 [Acidobacteriaceae bacterium]|jgi:hypothetical protein|nr:hypothetical protein [Acidobacteriaceae bacterium]
MKNLYNWVSAVSVATALCIAHSAYAAPVGSLTCSTATQDVKFNVSYFTFGLTPTLNIGSQGSGAGAGKVTFQPLEVHAALSTFPLLEGPAGSGTLMTSCTLTTTFSDGSRATFVFKPVAIQSLTAVAERTGTSDIPAQYTDVQFAYSEIQVQVAGGPDDGGTTPANWNQTTNAGPTGSGPN